MNTGFNAMNTASSIQITPSGGPLGAEIQGIDLRQPLGAHAVQLVRHALLAHCVVFFRDQNVSEHDQVRFTNYFGTAQEHVRQQPKRPVDEVFIISNVKQDGRPIGALGSGEVGFHSDLSYMRKPGTFSFLYAVEVPQTGGETQWCNCYAAYEALSNDMKHRLSGLRAEHRHYIEDQNPPELVDHPVVRTQYETDRKSLYVSPHLTKSIVGWNEAESCALLGELYEHLLQPKFIWTHQWQVGDVVVWDNRPTMHRRLAFPDDQRRIMKRTQIYGDEVPV